MTADKAVGWPGESPATPPLEQQGSGQPIDAIAKVIGTPEPAW